MGQRSRDWRLQSGKLTAAALLLLLCQSGEIGAATVNPGDVLVGQGGHARAIHAIDPVTGAATVVSNIGSLPAGPHDIEVEASGDLIVTERDARVFRIDTATGAQTLLSSLGLLASPQGIAIDANGDIFVADKGSDVVLRIDPLSGAQTLVSDGGLLLGTDPTLGGNPTGLTIGPGGDLFVTTGRLNFDGIIVRIDPATGAQTAVTAAGDFDFLIDLAFDASGDLIVAARSSVSRVDPATGSISTISSGGLFGSGSLSNLAIADNGDIYVTHDSAKNLLRVDPVTGAQVVVASFSTGARGLAIAPSADSDGDGLDDADELAIGTDPNDPDSDDDGLLDGTEVDIAEGSGCPDPLNPDSDGDTLSDGDEVNVYGTSPCNADSDGDGVSDDEDPLPLEPGATSGFIEDEHRELAATIDALDVSSFTGNNDNAAAGRRNALSNKANAAANAVAEGDIEGAVEQMNSLHQKLDGDDNPKDWMFPSPVKDTLEADVLLLIDLLLLL